MGGDLENKIESAGQFLSVTLWNAAREGGAFFLVSKCFYFLFHLQDWELMLLQELRWELSAVTPLDFLDHLMERLRLDPRLVDAEDVRTRAETALVLSAQEYKFCYLSPSLMAASALHAVASNLMLALLATEEQLLPPDERKILEGDLAGLLGRLHELSHAPEVRRIETDDI